MEEKTQKPVRSVVVKKTMSYMDDKAVFNERQLVALVQKTPKFHIKERKGKGGKQFRYVTGSYVQDRLNQVFGWGWSFEVKDHGLSPDKSSVWVLGKITILDPKSREILVTKEQFGASDIKKEKAGGAEVSYPNDLKSASTDALKKCASLLGVAADVYADPETAQEINDRVSAVVSYHREKKESESTQDQVIEGETVNVETTNA